MKKLIALSLCLMMLVGARAQQAAASANPNHGALAQQAAAKTADPNRAASADQNHGALAALNADSLARLKALPPAGQARMVSDMLKTQLALDAQQYQQVAGLALQLAQQVRPIMNSDDSRYSKLSQLRPLMQGAEQRLKTILKDDQYKKYLNFKQTLIDQARASRS